MYRNNYEDVYKVPSFGLIVSFCKSVKEFLSKSEDNVIVVHCKAGKGRTGLMICCYLLFSNTVTKPCDALQLFASKRTHNQKGVTIPSQRRYVHYFSMLLKTQK
ncbi:hypothetical protein MXB_4340 [Myxobolus squamalis]|nr:hypothetical protein MXB_4340 [Myxobolus squamalis]